MKKNTGTLILLDDKFNVDFFSLDYDLGDDIIENLDSFSELEDGWDFGRGFAIKKELIATAKSIYFISSAYGFLTEAYPNPDGTITLVLSLDDHFLDIDIHAPDKFILRYEIGKGNNYKTIWKDKEIKFSEIESILIVIKTEWHQTSSLESLTSGVIIDFQNIDLTTEEFLSESEKVFPFFAKTAPNTSQPMEYAII